MIGNQASQGGLNAALGAVMLSVRNDFATIKNLNDYITAQGGNTFLTGLGFLATDASAFTAALGNHDQLRQIYQGLINLPAAFNYQANGDVTWGGQ